MLFGCYVYLPKKKPFNFSLTLLRVFEPGTSDMAGENVTNAPLPLANVE